ncbi:MAG: hypothetical protein MJH09_05625 [Cetobacterium sp.]|nr:hypothetical protein [Cetobacterium sp.]
MDALNNNEKHVIVAMAPSVRTALGEIFKLEMGTDVTGKIYSAMREIGFKDVAVEFIRKRGHRWILNKRDGAKEGLGEYHLTATKRI